MRVSAKLFGAATILSALAVSAIAQATNNASEAESYLFIETADRATLTDDTMTLHGVSSDVPIFADRPYRSAGQISRADLLDAWSKGQDSFESDPPLKSATSRDSPANKGIIEAAAKNVSELMKVNAKRSCVYLGRLTNSHAK